MIHFIILMVGAIFGVFIAGLLCSSETAFERDRAEHAIKQAEKYKRLYEKERLK